MKIERFYWIAIALLSFVLGYSANGAVRAPEAPKVFNVVALDREGNPEDLSGKNVAIVEWRCDIEDSK